MCVCVPIDLRLKVRYIVKLTVEKALGLKRIVYSDTSTHEKVLGSKVLYVGALTYLRRF